MTLARSRRWRRNWPLVTALVAVIGLLLVGIGDRRVRAVTSSERTVVDAEPRGVDHGSEVDLFDPTVVHEISISFEADAYERMIEEFRNEEKKGWLSATVVIDGATVDNVGVRLKGNSSLFGLSGGPGGPGGPGAPGGDQGARPCPPDGVVDEAAGTCTVEVSNGDVLEFNLETGEGTVTSPDGTTAELLPADPGGPDPGGPAPGGPAPGMQGPGQGPGGPPCPPFAVVDEAAGTCEFDAPNGDHLVIDLQTGAGTATRPDGTVVELPPRPGTPGGAGAGPSGVPGDVVPGCPPSGEVDEVANTCTIIEPDGSVVVLDLETDTGSVTLPDGEVTSLPPPGESGPTGGPGGSDFAATEETPEHLPWLVKFDEFVDGQRYQGLEEVVVRSSPTATALNETLALGIVGLAGEPTQRSVHTAFSVNGGDRALRHLIEVPDDVWEGRSFGSDGVLYKALTRGTWQYQGEDPLAYTDSFSQETRRNRQDLQPLIDFVRFLDEADDESFASELPARLDVGSFARYLALMDLLANFDDIDGPGNNAYLRFDLDTERFRILTWDLNFALQGGVGRGPGPGERPEGEPGGSDQGPVVDRVGDVAQQGPADQAGRAGPGGALGPGGSGLGNPLVTRFRAVAAFADLIEQASTDLAADIYVSGTYVRILEERAEVLTTEAGDLVEPEVVQSEVEALHALIGQLGASAGG
ncbi:MAG: CotH kinase family protein [Acidimicrobiales bacterium]|nr:CotH kinase family protein [Acidimicrobiales bacterium]